MTTFHYKAIDAGGDVIEGDMAAPDQAAAVARLQQIGHLVLRADEATGGAPSAWLGRDVFANRSVPRKRLVLITRELATLLNAGLPLERSFEILIDLAQNEALRRLLVRVLEDVRGGSSLADALAAEERTFSPFYVNLVRAGEAGGALEDVLARLANHMEKSQALADSVRSALIYPAILLVMTGLSIVVLMTVVVPEFTPLFEDAGDKLPLATRVIIGTAEWLTAYWWLVVAVAAASVLILRNRLKNADFRYRMDRLILWLPLLGDLVSKVQVARLSRTLGTLVQSGLTLLGGLAIVQQTLSNSVLAQAVSEVSACLREGKGISQPLAQSGAFPALAVHLIRVGEETGELEQMLTKIANIYDTEVETTIERLVALLVPALTIGLGLIIAAIIGSVMLAFLSVNELAF